MSFSIFESEITLCSGDTVATYNISDQTLEKIILPPLGSAGEDGIRTDVDSYHTITSVSHSKDGEFFLVCTNRKQLCLYRRRTRELISDRLLVRAASRARFTPKGDIIVADKSGDTYLFSTDKSRDNGTVILGHLSMLLDVLVTKNEEYVVTADRDEKIRVSAYPNCYEIVSYCLGHEKFVTNIQELSHDENILVSSGGDGCLRFWDYKTGKELLSINVNENVGDADIEKFNQTLGECDMKESVPVLPIKHLVVSKIGDKTSVILATLHTCERLFLYDISGSIADGLTYKKKSPIRVDEEPLDCSIRNEVLWTLGFHGLTAYRFNNGEFAKDETINVKLVKVNEFWKTLEAGTRNQSLFPILYKRKFDNVQDYQERKRSRLTKVTE